MSRVGIYFAAALVAFFSAFPFAWMALTSLKTVPEILTSPPIFKPSEVTVAAYERVLEAGFTRALVNSIIIAGTTTILGVAVALLAGYSLARFRIPLKRYLMLLLLSVQLFPLIVLLIPLFMVLRDAHLLNSRGGLILTYLSFTVPLAVWIMRDFIATLPVEIEEAAFIDGANRLQTIFYIVLPLAGPGIAATAVLSFIAAWNEFIFALTFLSDESKATLPLALQQFFGRTQDDWGAIMAGSVLVTLPVVVFFLALHRRLTQGLTLGAVKG